MVSNNNIESSKPCYGNGTYAFAYSAFIIFIACVTYLVCPCIYEWWTYNYPHDANKVVLNPLISSVVGYMWLWIVPLNLLHSKLPLKNITALRVLLVIVFVVSSLPTLLKTGQFLAISLQQNAYLSVGAVLLTYAHWRTTAGALLNCFMVAIPLGVCYSAVANVHMPQITHVGLLVLFSGTYACLGRQQHLALWAYLPYFKASHRFLPCSGLARHWCLGYSWGVMWLMYSAFISQLPAASSWHNAAVLAQITLGLILCRQMLQRPSASMECPLSMYGIGLNQIIWRLWTQPLRSTPLHGALKASLFAIAILCPLPSFATPYDMVVVTQDTPTQGDVTSFQKYGAYLRAPNVDVSTGPYNVQDSRGDGESRSPRSLSEALSYGWQQASTVTRNTVAFVQSYVSSTWQGAYREVSQAGQAASSSTTHSAEQWGQNRNCIQNVGSVLTMGKWLIDRVVLALGLTSYLESQVPTGVPAPSASTEAPAPSASIESATVTVSPRGDAPVTINMSCETQTGAARTQPYILSLADKYAPCFRVTKQ